MATSNNSSVTLIARGNIRPNTIAVGGGKGGVSNYELLTHKPSINGHELIGNKTNADLGIPTDTQDLTNTAGFITKIVDDLVNYYTKLEIDDIINQIKQTSFRIVDDLPLVGDPGVIYLILNSTPQSRNYYDEYIYVDNRWEKIGTTEIDLSGYVTDEELMQVLRNYITNETLNETLRNYYNKADVNLLLAGKANSADLAAVATSGSYNDLQNKPVIPNKLADLTEDSTHRTVTDSEKETWNNKSDFSGSYNDLTDKPEIPIVYNSTITIKKNNQNIDSFTLNQSNNKSINMDVPEKTSDIQNDSGFITNTVNNLANYYLKSETYTKTEVSNLINAAVSGRFQKVNELPAQGEENVIYLVPKATVLVDNIYDEYIWEDGSWELIGDTQIDLSGYVTDVDLTAALQNYVTSATFNATISNYYTKTEVGNLLADKIDKVDGKGLSTYDYDAVAKAVVDSVTANLATKVDKVDGKGLSTNDYTTADKNKLAGIAEGAEVNVQSDWDETDDTQDDYIKNKPTKLSQFTNDSGFTKVESSEINGNIKIDGTETQVYDDSEIKGELTTDTTTIEGNPLNFSTLSAQTAKSTILSVEPIQDLHGYDKPWVDGAGKNKINTLDREITNTDSLTTIRTENCTVVKNGDIFNCTCSSSGGYAKLRVLLDTSKLENGATYTFSAKFDNPNSNYVGVGYMPNFQGSWIATASTAGGYKSISFVFDSSWTTILFGLLLNNSGTPNTNIVYVSEIQLEKALTKSDYEPYENICPISGRTEIGILGEGENRLNPNTVVAGYLSANGSLVQQSTTNLEYTSDYISLHGATIITAAYNAYTSSEVKWIGIGWYNENDEFMNRQDVQTNFSAITVPTGATKIRVSMRTYGHGVENCFVALVAATQYSPYAKSNDLTISLGQTVYGGTLDVENGVLVVDRILLNASAIIAGFTQYNSALNRYISFIYDTNNAIVGDVSEVNSASAISNICDCDLSWEQMSANVAYPNTIGVFHYTEWDYTRIYIYFGDSTVTTQQEAETYLTNKGVELSYKLATPTVIQLTPHQISLLKGVNNISTDGDKITLTYRDGKVATLGDIPSKISDLYFDIPGIVFDEDYTHTDNNYTDDEKNKLSQINIDTSLLPSLPAIIGDYRLNASVTLGGNAIFTWELTQDYSYLENVVFGAAGTGQTAYSKTDSSTGVQYNVISTYSVGRCQLYSNVSRHGAVSIYGRYGIYIPSNVSIIKLTAAPGSWLFPTIVGLHTFDGNQTLYVREQLYGWKAESVVELDIEYARANPEKTGISEDLFYFVDICKTNYQDIPVKESNKYCPKIEYIYIEEEAGA